MQLPKKAVIAVAGTGTRFLPATKVIPKEMLPIIDKPIVQYSVEEVINSGAKDVILVSREGVRSIREHFMSSPALEQQLTKTGKLDKLKIIKEVVKMANFIFVEQTKQLPYGTASPLLAAINKIKDEPFFYLFGDDMTLSKVPVCQQLVEVYKQNPDVLGVVAAQKIPRKYAYLYGMVEFKPGTKNTYKSIIEKPKPGEEPSTLAVFGRFLFSPKIVPIVKKLKLGKRGELEIMDAINELSKVGKILVHEIEGKWLTTGDALNYLKTMLEFVWQRKDLKKEFKKYVVDKLKE